MAPENQSNQIFDRYPTDPTPHLSVAFLLSLSALALFSQARRAIMIPGTVRLFAEGVCDKDATRLAVILTPRPSESPDDPLNFSMGRKYLSLSCIVL